jgi:hypothetical protein
MTRDVFSIWYSAKCQCMVHYLWTLERLHIATEDDIADFDAEKYL